MSFVITGAKTLVIKGSMTCDHVIPVAIKHSTLGDSLEAADSAIVVVHVVIVYSLPRNKIVTQK